MSTPVDLRVGGQNYRVLASSSEAELRRLAELVDERMRGLTAPGRQVSQQTLVLAALALAHDLEQERAARQALEVRSREMLNSVLHRLDAILDDGAGEAVAPAIEAAAAQPSPALSHTTQT